MGASFNLMHATGDRRKVAEEFQKVQDTDRYDNGHSYSGGFGMASGLSFSPQSFAADKEEEAVTWLEDNAQKWGPALAVKVGSDSDQHWLIGAWCSS